MRNHILNIYNSVISLLRQFDKNVLIPPISGNLFIVILLHNKQKKVSSVFKQSLLFCKFFLTIFILIYTYFTIRLLNKHIIYFCPQLQPPSP